jgi:hypothetical protein
MAKTAPGPSVGPAPVIPLFLLAAGGYLLWFGVHYWRDPSVRWPTDPVKGVLQGKGIPPHTAATTVEADLTAAVASGTAAQAASTGGGGAGAGGAAGIAPGQSMAAYIAMGAALGPNGTPGQNQALARAMMSAYDPAWTAADFAVLVKGWDAESGWKTEAFNQPGNFDAAYGIPQSDPGTKMASAGADWKTNPATQILWGFGYIKGKYGRPSTVTTWPPGPSYEGY